MQETEYLVVSKIGGAGDKEVWMPGSIIKMTPERAAIYLETGTIRVIETTVVPPPPEPTTIIHEASETVAPVATVGLAVAEEPTKRKGKGDQWQP